jgi:hypothetical protein
MQPGRALFIKLQERINIVKPVCDPFSAFTLQSVGVSARLSGPTPHAEVASQAGVVVPPEPLLKVEYGYISY